jgi:hypothetical protein
LFHLVHDVWRANKKSAMALTSRLLETFFIRRIIYVALFAAVVSAAIDIVTAGRFTVNSVVDLLIVAGLLVALLLMLNNKILLAGIIGGTLLAFLMSGEIIIAQYLKPGSTAVILVLGMLTSVVLTGIYRIVLHSVIFMCLATALGYLVYVGPTFPDGSSMLSNAANIVIIYGLIAFISFIVKSRYDDALRQLTQKNYELNLAKAEIETKQLALGQSMEEVKNLNLQLETTVAKQTAQVRRQNDLLVQHAFANAHHIRGPLARILGLVSLNDLDKGTDQGWLLQKIGEEANELDAIVEKIDADLTSIIE